MSKDSPSDMTATPLPPENDLLSEAIVITPPADQETGGVPGPEPTRYGDWEKNGRCIDF
jgi:hypothetical protein